MNKIYKMSLTLCCIFIICTSMGQPTDTADCHPNGPFISTAPITYTGQSYQTNTWDWMQEHLPSSNNPDYVAESNLNNNPLPAGLENPFYQMTIPYLGRIAGGTNSDFYPADGWELIKRDFPPVVGVVTDPHIVRVASRDFFCHLSWGQNYKIMCITGISIYLSGAVTTPTTGEISITDVAGRLVAQYNSPAIADQSIRQVIDVQSYSTGVYFVNIETNNQNHTIKFVKK
jgi:hypothetical protein